MTNFIFLLDINKRTSTVRLFLLFAVRVEIAKGEKNLQEAQKSKHHPMLSFWWLVCEICISKPRRNVQAVTPEPIFLVCSFFPKKKRRSVVYSGSHKNNFSNIFLHENCLGNLLNVHPLQIMLYLALILPKKRILTSSLVVLIWYQTTSAETYYKSQTNSQDFNLLSILSFC